MEQLLGDAVQREGHRAGKIGVSDPLVTLYGEGCGLRWTDGRTDDMQDGSATAAAARAFFTPGLVRSRTVSVAGAEDHTTATHVVGR